MRSFLARIPDGRGLLAVIQICVLLGLGAGLWLSGCSPNDPFDAETLENIPPVVRMSMTPVDPNQELNPTSYFDRTFNWSATDQDGWVTEYYVSVRTDPSVAAPWDTTLSTDTTMTFVTDTEGNASATFLLACRDNRGALSDTLLQHIPLRNFPPAVNMQADFNPLINMQREFRDINGDITEVPSAAVDTTYWNWGAMNFRLFALDLDGQETMDPYYRYTFKDTAEGDPDVIFLDSDPAADPAVGWVQVDFPQTTDEVKKFELFLTEVPFGPSTMLTVAVNDEADADTRFHYSWEVREPTGPVLYVPDNSSPITKIFYRNFLAGEYGEGGWSEYSFWFGYPDHSFVLLESMRKFQAVLWADGGTTSPRLEDAAKTGGVLSQYLFPLGGETPGRLLLISKGVVGTYSKLPIPFLKTVLGIDKDPAPVAPITLPAGKQALGLQPFLPAMTSANSSGYGLKVPAENIPKAEPIYQMEYCARCYGQRTPFDPVIGMRFPDRITAEFASSVTICVQLENFDIAQAYQGLSAILSLELGVVAK